MSEWIKQLENNFNHLNHNQGDLIEYIDNKKANLIYRTPDDHIFVDGFYTIQQLEDLVSHMKKYKGE